MTVDAKGWTILFLKFGEQFKNLNLQYNVVTGNA